MISEKEAAGGLALKRFFEARRETAKRNHKSKCPPDRFDQEDMRSRSSDESATEAGASHCGWTIGPAAGMAP
ncbi:MAG: hypothetical protein KDJ20_18155, partial [Hyphomicrobiales bacterium]|nr:hypothetical protein [Hyphomicrobiales bacterium]